MQLGGILQRLKTEGVLVAYIDYRSGSSHDWSENGRNAAVPTANRAFTKRGLQSSSAASKLTNDATLQATTTGTLIIRQKFPATTAPTPYMTRKGVQFEWVYSLSLTRYEFTSTAVTVTLNDSFVGMATHAIDFDNAGGTPKGYRNGNFLANYSGAITVTGSATDLSFGYLSTTGDFTNTEYFLLISRKLTAAEHSELYTYLQSLDWPTKVYGPVAHPYVHDLNDTSLGISYSGVARGGYLIDNKGLLNLPKVRSSSRNSITGKMRHCSNGMTIAGIAGTCTGFPASGASPITMTALVTPAGTGNVCISVATMKIAAPVNAWNMFLVNNALHVEKNDYNGSANSYYRPATTTAIVGIPTFVMGAFDPTQNLFYAGMNGWLYSGYTAGAIFAYNTPGYFIGGLQDTITGGNFPGQVGQCAIYNQLKDGSWFRKEWVKIAQAAQFKTDWGCKESVGNESTVGAFLGNGSTPFEILSGTWKVSTKIVDNEIHKVIECVSAGSVWLDSKYFNTNSSESAYGAWRMRFYRPANATSSFFAFTSTAKATTSSTTGYAIRMSNNQVELVRYSSGVYTNLVTEAVPPLASLTGDFQACRQFDNELYFSGRFAPGVVSTGWTDWVDSSKATDATYATSVGASFRLNAGDWVSLGTPLGEGSFIKFLGEFYPQELGE